MVFHSSPVPVCRKVRPYQVKSASRLFRCFKSFKFMCVLFWLSCLIQFYFCGDSIEYELCVFLTGHLDIFKEIGFRGMPRYLHDGECGKPVVLVHIGGKRTPCCVRSNGFVEWYGHLSPLTALRYGNGNGMGKPRFLCYNLDIVVQFLVTDGLGIDILAVLLAVTLNYLPCNGKYRDGHEHAHLFRFDVYEVAHYPCFLRQHGVILEAQASPCTEQKQIPCVGKPVMSF